MHRRSLLLAGLAFGSARAQETAPLTVFAAASLQDGLRALEPLWRAAAAGNPPVRFSFAASSALARQVEQGAPADLFLSADEPWMDYLAQRGLILRESRVSPLGNALVLIAPADSTLSPPAPGPGMDLAGLLGPQGRLATGDPAHVPAGLYAKAALENFGQWAVIAPRLARAENVRAALLLVERGEAPLGIVYATDARASQGVKVLGTFPPGSHPPVTYPFAVTRRAADRPAARMLLAFLAGPVAAETWRRFGFTTAGP
ncbi:molybdate ABC transporter substrate-binding protein [Dankookia sp. GCM10030260]|uniref:molybdate ABC transporter substrate-binding protein n=1 Tax=Dankookia sp. GCM10030260 TaxID=3273390 RepID=UPI00360B8679